MVQNILTRIKLDKKWYKINTEKSSEFYFIGIKDQVKKLTESQIDTKLVDKIYFEVGIDSGIKNKPLTINHIILDFKDQTSSEDINDITAFTKVQGLPKEFYIRPTSIITYNNIKYTADKETSVSVNINLI